MPILLAASMVALGFGLSLPVMTVERMYFWQDDYSLITGAQGLWDRDERFLAAVLFIFSGVFPVLKLGLMSVLLLIPMRPRPREVVSRVLEAAGRWSMLDVFVVAMFIVLARSSLVAAAAPGPGLYVFCGAILGSMVVAFEINRLARRHAAAARTD